MGYHVTNYIVFFIKWKKIHKYIRDKSSTHLLMKSTIVYEYKCH